MAPPIAVLDVDGTLVDTNYHHAIAWYRAFREHGLTVPVWRIHRHIGTGGDQLVGAVAVFESLGELCERLGETPLAEVCAPGPVVSRSV